MGGHIHITDSLGEKSILSCSGKHVYSSCTDAGWFSLTCHTHVVSNQEKTLSMAMNILHKIKSEQPFPNQLTFHKATAATAQYRTHTI